jgi:hypothetical protein
MILALILAQAEGVPSEYIKNFALVLAGAAATAYYVKVLFWGESPKTPQPFTVSTAKDYVHKEDFNKLVDENNLAHRDLFSKIGGVERGTRQHLENKLDAMQASQDEGRDKLHNRINLVLEAVSEFRGTVNEMRNK